MIRPTPIELANSFVSLSPLTMDEAPAFFEIGQDPEIWSYLSAGPFKQLDDARAWISAMLTRSKESGDVVFSVYDNTTKKLAGSSSLLDARVEHRGLEIGYTWYGKDFQRTHVNTATKLALLTHAFESLGANRVQLQTDSRNLASQRAIERLGATREGVLRQHKVYPSGYVRDSVLFSIVIDDWQAVKANLMGFLERTQ